MTCIVWPTELPTPEISVDTNYNLPLAVSGKNKIGAFESLRKQTHGTYFLKANLRLSTKAEFEEFKRFWRRDLLDGMKPFDAEWIFHLGYNGYQAKIVKWKETAQGSNLIISMDMVLHQVLKEPEDPTRWYQDPEAEDEDFDPVPVNPCDCSDHEGNHACYFPTGVTTTGGTGTPTQLDAGDGWVPTKHYHMDEDYWNFTPGYFDDPVPIPTYFEGEDCEQSGATGEPTICPDNGDLNGSYSVGTGNIAAGAGSHITDSIDCGCAEFEFFANLLIPDLVDTQNATIDITLQWLDSAFGILWSHKFPQFATPNALWHQIHLRDSLPAGTRKIRYILDFKKNEVFGGNWYGLVNNMKARVRVPWSF